MNKLRTLGVVAAAILLLPMAAQAQNEDRNLERLILGKWSLDKEKTTKELTDKLGDGQAEQILAQLTEYSIHFKRDGDAEVTFFGRPQDGTWEITELDPENKTLKIKLSVRRQRDTGRTAKMQFIDEDTLLMISDGSQIGMVFSRFKPDDDRADDDRADDDRADDRDVDRDDK